MNVSAKATTIALDATKVTKKADEATLRALYKQAAWIRKVAMQSLVVSDTPSPPGSPPHTKTKRLPKSIRFEVDRGRFTAIIGPDSDRVGEVGGAHEFGGSFKKESYPARPFMRPALEKSRPHFEDLYRDSVK